MTGSSNYSSGFKGYPILDFVDPGALTVDGFLRNTALKTALEQYITGSSPHEKDPFCGYSKPSKRPKTRPFEIPPKVATADESRTAQSFKDRLVAFLDGLYLGCFESSVLQPDKRRPPSRYIYDIGFNTDKLTGFIVPNPFDTLVTFGPRGRHAGYGAFDPAVLGLPRATAIKVTEAQPPPRDKGKKDALVGPHFVTTFETADAKGTQPIKASIICDLNIRFVVDQRQVLQELSVYGDTMKVHLSRGLVQPVERSVGDKWVRTGKRLKLDMSKRVITLRRNRLPSWGGPIDLGGSVITITASGVIGRLHHVNLGGTVAKPLIVFDGVEIVT